ncbi:sodium:calcium antiporter [Halalkalicoccus salilacus]|uniref:sodium:calcium antiporter n=1 Tax=Halalkalicoccus sp. GCM10025704 TaxID=3252662 RepID=UPI00361CAF20
MLTAFGLSGLAFGATVMSFIASLEELFLTVEPVRQGRPEIAVGNVVGSTLFYVTANVGLIALIGPVDMGGAVLTVQWPFFALALVLVVAMFYRGRVGRLEGWRSSRSTSGTGSRTTSEARPEAVERQEVRR